MITNPKNLSEFKVIAAMNSNDILKLYGLIINSKHFVTYLVLAICNKENVLNYFNIIHLTFWFSSSSFKLIRILQLTQSYKISSISTLFQNSKRGNRLHFNLLRSKLNNIPACKAV